MSVEIRIVQWGKLVRTVKRQVKDNMELKALRTIHGYDNVVVVL